MRLVPVGSKTLTPDTEASVSPHVVAIPTAAADGVLEAVLAEQQGSLELLRTGGTEKPWDLPTAWLANSSAAVQAPPPPLPACGAGPATPATRISTRTERLIRQVRKTHSAPSQPPDIVFFNANAAPFVLGEVLSVDTRGKPGKVTVHWYGPISKEVCNKEVRTTAGSTPVVEYAASRFSPDFLRKNGKKALTPDAGVEALTGIIACCKRLTKTKNIPATVQKELVDACGSSTSSSDEEESSSASSSEEESEEESSSEESEDESTSGVESSSEAEGSSKEEMH